ncbi:MAG: hypothetical protein GX589_04030 [Deltaproteobacteria bacterium]|nr:hypothetical protein [Deltaproteobacteria bacterium]
MNDFCFWHRSKSENPNTGRGADKGRVVFSASARGSLWGFLFDLLTLPLLPHFVALVCVCCLILVTSWLWIEMRQRFPALERGSYVGEIEGVFSDEHLTRFFVESMPSGELYVAAARDGWKPEKITMVGLSDDSDDGKWVHPLVLVGPDAKLRLSGARKEAGVWHGKVKDLLGGGRGLWRLQFAPEIEVPEDPAGRVDLQLWLRLRAESDAVHQEISGLRDKVPKQRKEIDKLTKFITEGDSLRARADQKYRETKADLEALKAELKQKRLEAQDLEKKLVVSRSVTPRGKLVSLARLSLEREARWIDSLLQGGAQRSDPDLEVAVESSRRILDLKDRIDQERERIQYLRSKQGGVSVESGPPSFDSIWGQQ